MPISSRSKPAASRWDVSTTDSHVVGWEMLRRGLGIGGMLREVAAATPGVQQVLPELPPIPVPYWLCTHRELCTSRRIRVTFDLLAEALAGELPSRAAPRSAANNQRGQR